VAPRGKTESWYLLDDDGELFVGCAPGTTRESFAAALRAGAVAGQLNRFHGRDGDCFHLPARTVHALGAGSLICEVQQTCDTTFRVFDWGRVGLDGRPRQLHVQESLATIDYAAGGGPVTAAAVEHPAGGTVRRLVSCAYYLLEERRALHTRGGNDGRCAIIVNLAGSGRLATAAGEVALAPMQTWLVPADAGPWSVTADAAAGLEGLRLLVATPVL
jgi:mannose-6-phosphate isomerase